MRPDIHIACWSFFKRSGLVQWYLTPTEYLRAYDMPLGMDVTLSADKHAHDILVWGISPLIVMSILRSMWVGGNGGGRGDDSERQEDISPVPIDLLAMEVDGRREVLDRSVPKEVKIDGIKNGLAKGMVTLKSNTLKCRGSLGTQGSKSLDCVGPQGSTVQATIAMVPDPISSDNGNNALFNGLKKEHDLAKAVKRDNAEVLGHLWDAAVWVKAPNWMCKQEGNPPDPPEVFKQAMTGFCQLCMRLYRRRLWKEIYHRLLKKYGHGWVTTGRREGNRGATVKIKATYECHRP
jgi:hypothetical protein